MFKCYLKYALIILQVHMNHVLFNKKVYIFGDPFKGLRIDHLIAEVTNSLEVTA